MFNAPRLAMHAFHCVLMRKQSGYQDIIGWLGERIEELGRRKDLRLPTDVRQYSDEKF